MKDVIWTALVVVLALGWFVLAAWAVTSLGPATGGAVAFSAPLLFLGLAFAAVWGRGRRHRRKLMDQEFRE